MGWPMVRLVLVGRVVWHGDRQVHLYRWLPVWEAWASFVFHGRRGDIILAARRYPSMDQCATEAFNALCLKRHFAECRPKAQWYICFIAGGWCVRAHLTVAEVFPPDGGFKIS